MASALASFVALFAAVFFLLMGTGLLGTLLSLRMAISGLSAQVTGWVMAAYFAGLVLGSFTCQRLVQRVGHVRSFAAFAAVTTATVMLHGLYFSAFFWGILRFLTGITSMGLYMVIESWLNECAEAHTRGRVFSIYMVLSYLGMGTGQLLLNAGDVRSQELFLITGIFLALCLVPIAVTSSVHPKMSKTISFNLADLMQRAPLGILGCLSAGLINGAFYALGPVFSNQIGLTDAQVAWFMTSTIFGGLLLQWPVGFLSDRFDRTLVLPILAVAIGAACAGIMAVAGKSWAWLLTATGIFGGLAFTIYPVAVARTHDLFDGTNMIPVSSGLLLSYGIGASIAPIAASTVINALESPYGLFIYFALVSLTYAGVGLYLRKKEIVEIISAAEQIQFVPMKNTSPVAMEIDPRAELPKSKSVSS